MIALLSLIYGSFYLLFFKKLKRAGLSICHPDRAQCQWSGG
jgi:hypothetical protein